MMDLLWFARLRLSISHQQKHYGVMANFLKMKQFKQSKIVKIVLETHKQQQIRLLLATIAEIDLN